MNVLLCLLGLMTVLSGCGGENRELQAALEFRENLLKAQQCSFSAEITADYGDSLTEFTMECQGDNKGGLEFEIRKPEVISGIQGTVSDSGGTVRFEEDAVYFPLLTDDLLTPASAPWIFLKTLRSGCISAVCREEDLLHMTVDDSYAEDALRLDIWLRANVPVQADISHNGRRILSLEVKNFDYS